MNKHLEESLTMAIDIIKARIEKLEAVAEAANKICLTSKLYDHLVGHISPDDLRSLEEALKALEEKK